MNKLAAKIYFNGRSKYDDDLRWAIIDTTRMGIGRNVCWTPEMNDIASNQHLICDQINRELKDERRIYKSLD